MPDRSFSWGALVGLLLALLAIAVAVNGGLWEAGAGRSWGVRGAPPDDLAAVLPDTPDATRAARPDGNEDRVDDLVGADGGSPATGTAARRRSVPAADTTRRDFGGDRPFRTAEPTAPRTDREVAVLAPTDDVSADADDRCMTLPVLGVGVDELSDTFDDPRGGGRVHAAADIMAPRWTPVVAAAEGEVQKIWESETGGNTVYVLGDEVEDGRRLRYYYAHLEAYREGLDEGEDVDEGEVIAYVGDSGNAVPGNTHLHFAVMEVDEEEDWAGGTPLDPLPYLRCEIPLPD